MCKDGACMVSLPTTHAALSSHVCNALMRDSRFVNDPTDCNFRYIKLTSLAFLVHSVKLNFGPTKVTYV